MNFIVPTGHWRYYVCWWEDIVGAYVGNELRGIAKLQYQPSLNKLHSISYGLQQSKYRRGDQIPDMDASRLVICLGRWVLYLPADDIKGSLSSCIVLLPIVPCWGTIFIHEGWTGSMNFAMSPSTPNAVLSSLYNLWSFDQGQTAFSAYSQNASSWIGTFHQCIQYHSLNDDSISLDRPVSRSETQAIPFKCWWNWLLHSNTVPWASTTHCPLCNLLAATL